MRLSNVRRWETVLLLRRRAASIVVLACWAGKSPGNCPNIGLAVVSPCVASGVVARVIAEMEDDVLEGTVMELPVDDIGAHTV